MTTHLIIPDSHAHPDHHNERADWLSRLIIDIRPDVVVNIGDNADMPSLSSYDKGKRSFNGRTYRADIDSHLDFQERVWDPIRRRKQKLPYRVYCIGNHEQRIERALDLSPELVGTIGYNDLDLGRYYDEVVHYVGGTPGTTEVDGIRYGHYVPTGVSGRPISGDTLARSLVGKRLVSTTVGHSHLLDYYSRVGGDGNRVHGLSVGCYQDYVSDWAGEVSYLWWSGIVVKRNVEDGNYDPQFISIESLRREYGRGSDV